MPYNNPNSYGSLYIDGIRTPFLEVGEIDDSPSDGGAICSVTIPGYLPTLKLSPKAEIYDYHGDLAAIGSVQIDNVKTGLRPKTSFNLISYSKHLQRKRIVGQFSNTLTLLLAALITQGNASAFFPLIIFRTSPEVPSIIVSRYVDFKHLKDAIPEVLSQTGKVLTYKVPIDQSGIEIIEPGFAGLAPIPLLRLDDFYINKKIGINNVTYAPVGRLASVVRFFGLNGREYFKSYLGKAKQLPLDPLVMRAKDGVNNYSLPEKATKIILIRVTTPDTADPCINIPYSQSGAEEVFSTEPLTELVTFPARAGIKDTIPADTTGTFDHLADFTLDLSDPALVGHPLKLYLYYGITGHETSGVTVTVQVKASPGAPEAIFSDGLTALSGDFPTAFDPETYIIQSLNTDPGEELWLPISPIDISAYIGNPDLFIRLTIAGIVETAGDRNTIAGAFFRTDCIPDCPSFVDLISLISSSGSINLIDTDEIIVEGAVAGDDNPGVSASATYEIDLTHANFEGHSINFAYTYNLFFTSSDTNTTVEYSNTVTANGDSLLDFTDTDTIVAPANSEREDTVNLDLTDYIGTIVTIVISVNNTFSPSADGAEASFAISGILSC